MPTPRPAAIAAIGAAEPVVADSTASTAEAASGSTEAGDADGAVATAGSSTVKASEPLTG